MPDSSEGEADPLIEQALRLGELRQKVMEQVDGPTLEAGTGDLDMHTQESFWKHVLAFESAEESTHAERLRNEAGFVPDSPDELSSASEVHTALWNLLNALATIRTFVSGTDHLNDADLYRLLVNGVLPGSTTVPPTGSEWNCRIDACEYGTADDPDGTATWLRYYADDQTREEWDGEIPPKETLPYDRDQHLPVPPEEQAND